LAFPTVQTTPSGKPREDDPDSLVGELLGDRYRIDELLGMGGIGAVFRAHDVKLDRDVAVKVLLPAFVAYDELRLRFDREARALAALSHPHVVPIGDYGFRGETPYLVMELLEGRTLGETLEDEGALDLERSLGIARQVLGALAFAHGRGLIHRDLKPGNVFLQSFPGSEDHVRILDFGLAKFLTADRHAGLTRMGDVFGTPAYMAPEQAAGSAVDERVDVYAAGILLFEMVTGRKAFDGEPGEVLRKQLVEPMAELKGFSDHPMAEALDRVLQRATRKVADERYRHAGEMLAALDVVSGRLSLGRAPTLLAEPAVRTPTIPRLRTDDGGPKTTPWAGSMVAPARATGDATIRSVPPPPRATLLLLVVSALVLIMAAVLGAAAALFFFGGDG
jgi:serine/threonine-protein kinase